VNNTAESNANIVHEKKMDGFFADIAGLVEKHGVQVATFGVVGIYPEGDGNLHVAVSMRSVGLTNLPKTVFDDLRRELETIASQSFDNAARTCEGE
jgi:fibrillarin-like rRNA methylase